MDWERFELALAFVAGGLFNLVIDWARSVYERRQRKKDLREEFQHETLVELQDALFQFMRALQMMKANHAQLISEQPPIEWPQGFDPTAMSHIYGQRIPTLTERVNDEELRTLLRGFGYGYSMLRDTDSDDESYVFVDAMQDIQEEANARIGELLRRG